MTKKYFILAVYLFVLFLLQAAGSQVFRSTPYFVPQLVLLFVLIFALRHSLVETLWFSFGAGFLLEFFSGTVFGGQILSLVLSGLAVYFLTRHLTAQEISAVISALLVVAATFLYGILIYLYNYLWKTPFDFYSVKILWLVIINILFFYPVKFIFKLCEGRLL